MSRNIVHLWTLITGLLPAMLFNAGFHASEGEVLTHILPGFRAEAISLYMIRCQPGCSWKAGFVKIFWLL